MYADRETGGIANSATKNAAAGAASPVQPIRLPARIELPAKKALSGRARKLLLLSALALAIVGGAGSFGYRWWTVGRFIESTDDAYVGAHNTTLAAKVAGYIATIAVEDNTQVRAGDVIATIDEGDFRLAVDQARDKVATQKATIDRIGRQVVAQQAAVDQAKAQLASAQAASARAQLELDRQQTLAQRDYASRQTLEQAQSSRDQATAGVQSAQAAVDAAQANVEVLKGQQQEAARTLDELNTALAKAERDLSFTRVLAPFDGIVGNKAAEVGNFVQPAARLMALVPLNASYVDANFKETQLADIKPGQKVDVAIDALGGKVIEGTVTSIAPASGAQFSLLPPDNATGNFTKVVQRVPVRVTFSDEVLKSAPLRPGLSDVATVHTRDPDAPRPTLLGALGLEGFAAKLQLAKP